MSPPSTPRGLRFGFTVAIAICLVHALTHIAWTQSHSSAAKTAKTGAPSMSSTPSTPSTPSIIHASGSFEVKLTPQPPPGKPEDSPIARMSIDKQLHGDLEATSKGEMLAFSTDTKGSAGYVAMERLTGTLQGRNGSFVLQHTATMNRGVPHMSITVVPDSGTGQLVGLSGKMDIQIADGKHSYTFDYTLPQT